MEKRANGEGSIYQCKRGQWVIAISLGAGKRKYFYCRNQGSCCVRCSPSRQKAANTRFIHSTIYAPERLVITAEYPSFGKCTQNF